MSEMDPISNPFSSRFTRPGAIVPLDARGMPLDVDALIGRLDRLGGTAAIVGPHGSGKSTLLVHLAAALKDRGRRTRVVRLRSWRDLRPALVALQGVGPGGTLCVDSWECIGMPAGAAMRAMAALSSRCLLVTSHRSSGFPVLVRKATSTALMRRIVAMLPESRRWLGATLGKEDVDGAFAGSGGNVRDALATLYDLFEARTRSGMA